MSVLQELAQKAKEQPIEKLGDIYHPIPFEEFSGLKTSSNHKAVEKKWGLIKSTLETIYGGEIKGKKVLDVGANAGFYSFNFAKMGNAVTSFEIIERYSEIAKAVVKEKDVDVDWFAEPFRADFSLPHKKYDVALLLSVYQWMAEGGPKQDYANESLRKISEVSDYLVFELGFNKGKSCIKTDKFNHYKELIRLLEENTTYSNFKLIGKTRLWGYYTRFLVICSNNPELEDEGFRKFVRGL